MRSRSNPMGLYVLGGKGGQTAIAEPDVHSWAIWMGESDRGVAMTGNHERRVSTVFLGVDHSFGWGKPLLFETMVFGGAHDCASERYATWAEAEAGHKRHCEKVFGKAFA